MRKTIALHALKLLGIALFTWIVWSLDKERMVHELQNVRPELLLTSFAILFLLYLCKTWRWHVLINIVPLHTKFSASWRIFNIGAFLATITPAKLGEFGKAAYLMKAGMKKPTAVAITIADRIADAIVIGVFGILALGILFDPLWLGAAIAGTIIIGSIGWFLVTRKRSVRLALWLFPHMDSRGLGRICAKTLGITLLSWSMYFLWALTLATAVGITLSSIILVAAFVLTGIVSQVPIAPSGLGTRDAALITLLAPYGVPAEQAVALAFLMFISIILSGFLGGWYFLKGVR